MHAQVDEERAALERANRALRGGSAAAGGDLPVLPMSHVLVLISLSQVARWDVRASLSTGRRVARMSLPAQHV